MGNGSASGCDGQDETEWEYLVFGRMSIIKPTDSND